MLAMPVLSICSLNPRALGLITRDRSLSSSFSNEFTGSFSPESGAGGWGEVHGTYPGVEALSPTLE